MAEGINTYLSRYGCDCRWSLSGAQPTTVRAAVVIPVLAESAHLFRTLESIAQNDARSLAETMVICVVNNGLPGIARPRDRKDNEKTLAVLRRLVMEKTHPGAAGGLSIGYVDASSPGRELPVGGGGVGLARKIGMDRALELFDHRSVSPSILLCLDADTIVENNWISAVRKNFETRNLTAAAVEFLHQPGENDEDDDAICLYETFIRYYRLGLEYACSPYAWHAIGSTIAVTAGGYAAVRGMSRREAGEDFHFLNKVTKIGAIGLVTNTRVYPSARRSQRVPFGTGRTISRYASHGGRLGTAWDPEVFRILKDWIACLGEQAASDTGTILERARHIHVLLPDFLRREGFHRVWPRLLENAGRKGVTEKQYSGWFDALKTYKMIRYMSVQAFKPLPLYEALRRIIAVSGRNVSTLSGFLPPMPDRTSRRLILEELTCPSLCTATASGRSSRPPVPGPLDGTPSAGN
ncbi:MAG: glycosyltransferase family 2 protein [Syntrophales bacterium]|jgi:hypothetical protein|nr:glycosyltransferase family 2 protein [Syntrophales bacterium]MCK9528186.1 glycosyltransferase family 2 protein [Syntrophales bacterium]MDX9921333.1 glycosyltransferase family A protein [Syntrophales bacterium]